MSVPIVEVPGEGSEDDSSSIAGASNGGRRLSEYSGWVFHLGVNSIGHEYCHLRYLYLRGKYVAMYKRDPYKERDIKPIRKGVISHNLMVEELGRRKIVNMELFVLKLWNRLDETKKGEIACRSAGDAHKWVEAFEHGKAQAEYDIFRGGSRHLLTSENELNLEGHRPRVRRYAYGLRKLIKIGKGPEGLLRQSSDIGNNVGIDTHLEEDVNDAAGAHVWRCVKITNGIRIFEDMRESKGSKSFLMKSVGVVDADVDTVFETIISVDGHKRYEWDTITGDLQLIDEVNGHFDIVYGTYNPKFLNSWRSNADFVFSRQWICDQDGSYTILQIPTVHKKHPPTSHYKRIQINPSTWEIRKLNKQPTSSVSKCLVTQIVEVRPGFWDRWRKRFCSGFENTMSFALLCQVSGLREYFGANPELSLDSISYTRADSSDMHTASPIFEDSDIKDEFYDAIANSEILEDEDSDEECESQGGVSMKLRNISWAIASLSLKRTTAKSELDANISPVTIDLNKFHGSLHQAKNEADTNCWACPSGQGFMIRGKTYLSDFAKVMGGEPLLKLVAVDWFKTENRVDGIALHPNSLVQSEAGKELPFIVAINLQVPAKPNYNLVLYYVAERPVNQESLLGRFINGTDVFRNARFKLIPSIVEGYWMVKRAVGSKACLLGKAVSCKYILQDNFLEVDVDIGSSSVARSIIGLVLGYVTSIVVDLAILVEAKEEKELPEYILGTVRLNRLKPETAVPL